MFMHLLVENGGQEYLLSSLPHNTCEKVAYFIKNDAVNLESTSSSDLRLRLCLTGIRIVTYLRVFQSTSRFFGRLEGVFFL